MRIINWLLPNKISFNYIFSNFSKLKKKSENYLKSPDTLVIKSKFMA